MGIPPFGGFFSKYLVFSGAVNSGQTFIMISFLICALLTILYLFRLFNAIFLGEGTLATKEGSKLMVASVAVLAILSLLSGIYIRYPSEFVQMAVKQMMGI